MYNPTYLFIYNDIADDDAYLIPLERALDYADDYSEVGCYTEYTSLFGYNNIIAPGG